MSFSRFALAGLLLSVVKADILPSSSNIAVSSQAQVQPSVHCRTILGTKSVSSVPTTTKTRHIHDPTPVVIFTTVQDTVTSTPLASTILATDYATTTVTTTATPATDVFSTTSTAYEYATSWVTPSDFTTTVWSTDLITQTSTTTIATSAGFTPIVDTFTTATAQKRSLNEGVEQCTPWLDDYQYPKEVVCEVKYIIKTTTVSTVTEAPATATAVAPSTTVTLTSTVTSNTVLIPSDVSITSSFSTTSYVTVVSDLPVVTDTVTSTTSQVVAISTTSAYAACATNNIASAPLGSEFGIYAGQYIFQIVFSHLPDDSISVGDSTSETACCESCQESSTCALSYYHATSTSKWCYLMNVKTCAFSSDYATAYVEDNTNGFSVSNGNCAHYVAYA
ncbi:hypothetical protein N7495_007188 [Penicillium taxi]|uniref:uncharacterized protein n=1 Tax=Penicillium taxi TaxID=168475 RepID=UPI0025455410|nr:uncharacterized protein N7495_007188 [Penicillium taxi]KAJ5895497.1 hypothetical protein N7495_007188 [Penicillium taxi]